MTNNKKDKSTWAIGAGILMGIGVGLFFVQKSPIAYIACMFLGLGLGLMITVKLSRERSGK